MSAFRVNKHTVISLAVKKYKLPTNFKRPLLLRLLQLVSIVVTLGPSKKKTFQCEGYLMISQAWLSNIQWLSANKIFWDERRDFWCHKKLLIFKEHVRSHMFHSVEKWPIWSQPYFATIRHKTANQTIRSKNLFSLFFKGKNIW